MLSLIFGSSSHPLKKIMCLGAHSDDIEIGCGGTILKLVENYRDLAVSWIVFSSNPQRRDEAIKCAGAFLEQVQDKRIVVHEFKDGYFPYVGHDIKDYFENLKKESPPDLIFTHYGRDLHQDHRIISELTWNTFRGNLILEYEIPKYDGDLGSPNVFVHLSQTICNQKIANLLAHFATQSNKHWFTAETFASIMRLRGIESRSPDQYAEAFYARKLVVE